MRFRKYINEQEDIFGFDKEIPKKAEKTSNNDPPIDDINSEQILSELSRVPMGTKQPIWEWSNKVQWGENFGAIEADVSPLGSYKTIIRRLSTDLHGEPIWICKKVVPFVENDDNKNESGIAYKLIQYVRTINEQMIDSPNVDYKDFRNLSQALASKVKFNASDIFVYEGARQVSENYSLIWFSYRGAGQEAPGGHKAEQFNVHLTYDPSNGLLRSWGNEISSPKSGQRWQIQPSEWDELFLPSQPISEITNAIVEALSTY